MNKRLCTSYCLKMDSVGVMSQLFSYPTQMERQMSMNSNIMGMQGHNLGNPCASPQVPPMHSDAKMVRTPKAGFIHIV